MTIPKIIHQIWIGDQLQRPALLMDKWKEFNPDYEYMLWTDCPDWLQNKKAYDLIPEIAGKADIMRYEILHKYGGIYVDADIEPLMSISQSLLEISPYCFATWENEIVRIGMLSNSFLGCAPEHKFFKHVINLLHAAEQVDNYYTGQMAWESTGTQFLTKAMTLFSPDNITVLPAYTVNPIHFTGAPAAYAGLNQSIGHHHWGSTYKYAGKKSIYDAA